ncbi:MAG: flavodoxin-dependent (E)-4-hydroxy-3-methylbut-2-enyl-diphosphate synthase [Nitrospirae bacterium]|nr:flavodoxin-dependent (E)-4-hydroxy-3-methylbut-2-enyl-diphosphate synthase [Nitrospirota bacterium]
MLKRAKTRQIRLSNVTIGGDAPVSVQSMTKTRTTDVESTAYQINSLEIAGCELIRLAVPNMDAALCLGKIKAQIHIPMIADIHFDWKLALEAVAQGVDGLRINPGNIGPLWKVKEVVTACKDNGIPIRIGVNGGSLQKDILAKYGHPTPEAIVESAERHIEILYDMDFKEIKVSLKASNVPITIEAYRLFSSRHDIPLHIGISEAGIPETGIIKSAVGLGALLYDGIGDTMRVSLTSEPEEEVRVAYEILKSLGIRQRGINFISCPTCGRTRVNLVKLAHEASERLKAVQSTVTVAIMGCEVNGPGEAKEADYGIASGSGEGLLFKKGTVVRKVKESDLITALIDLINEEVN